MTGMEWALNAVFKQMGIDPDTGKKQLAETVQIILTVKDQLDRIERSQDLILSALSCKQISNAGADENGPEYAGPNGSGDGSSVENP